MDVLIGWLPFRAAKEEYNHEGLSPARGVMIGLALCAVFWLGALYLFFG